MRDARHGAVDLVGVHDADALRLGHDPPGKKNPADPRESPSRASTSLAAIAATFPASPDRIKSAVLQAGRTRISDATGQVNRRPKGRGPPVHAGMAQGPGDQPPESWLSMTVTGCDAVNSSLKTRARMLPFASRATGSPRA